MRTPAWLAAGLLPHERYPQTTTEPATAWMRAALELWHTQAPFVVAAIVLVLGLLVLSTLRMRAQRAQESAPPKASAIGALWTLLPLAAIALIAWPALQARLMPPAAPKPALRVHVVGHQWWWEFKYDDHGFRTATELHVPVGQPVELIVESADVQHSLWIPAIGPRQDVPPLEQRSTGKHHHPVVLGRLQRGHLLRSHLLVRKQLGFRHCQVVGKLDRVDPGVGHGAAQVAEGARAVVREADEADASLRVAEHDELLAEELHAHGRRAQTRGAHARELRPVRRGNDDVMRRRACGGSPGALVRACAWVAAALITCAPLRRATRRRWGAGKSCWPPDRTVHPCHRVR